MTATVICNCTITLPEGKARDIFIKNLALYRDIEVNELSDVEEVWAQVQQKSLNDLQKKVAAEAKTNEAFVVVDDLAKKG